MNSAKWLQGFPDKIANLLKIPKFGVNQASFDWDTAILNVQINKEMYGHPDAVSGWP